MDNESHLNDYFIPQNTQEKVPGTIQKSEGTWHLVLCTTPPTINGDPKISAPVIG